MSRSIRSRLTLWYSAVVIVVLATFTVAVSIAQRRLELSRIDAEIVRLSLVVEGVMRMEFSERLTLQAAAAETSIEIVAPDHAMRLEQIDGGLLAEWGLPLRPSAWPRASEGSGERIGTFEGPSGVVRVLQRVIRSDREPYVVLVAAPLRAFAERQRETAAALWIGTFMALLVSTLGGWLVGRQTLEPLASMARQAAAASDQPDTIRLSTPNQQDEPGRLAAAFNALLDRIGATAGQQRQFMADASHELRTPLSVIKTAAEAALNQPHRDEAEYREALEIVTAQAARLTRLVDDMLFLSRSDAGGLTPRRDAVHLDEVAADAVTSARVVADRRRVSFTVVAPQPVEVVGDEGQLHRMIVNLLTNAARHATPGTVVTVDVAASKGDVALRVSNEGAAIPPADQPRIFDRFVSLDPESDGAGLGLPIARRIAEGHGGRLSLLSSDTATTTFEVRLPL